MSNIYSYAILNIAEKNKNKRSSHDEQNNSQEPDLD